MGNVPGWSDPYSRLSFQNVHAYRHLFHAGNFADVFKHATLMELTLALQRKDKPFLYLDTHSGIGVYDLQQPWAQKNREFDDGIGRIFDRDDAPLSVRPYLDAVRAENPDGKLRFYPGSPVLVRKLLRPHDRMVLTELNPEDCVRLQRDFEGERGVQVRNMDGYQALKAFLPPPERRGLILVDSSFDRAQEFARLSQAIIGAYKRFATGVFAIWYPLMQSSDVSVFEQSFIDAGLRKVLRLELSIRDAGLSGQLSGSAMIVINPPYRVDEVAESMLRWLWSALSPDGKGNYHVGWLAGE